MACHRGTRYVPAMRSCRPRSGCMTAHMAPTTKIAAAHTPMTKATSRASRIRKRIGLRTSKTDAMMTGLHARSPRHSVRSLEAGTPMSRHDLDAERPQEQAASEQPGHPDADDSRGQEHDGKQGPGGLPGTHGLTRSTHRRLSLQKRTEHGGGRGHLFGGHTWMLGDDALNQLAMLRGAYACGLVQSWASVSVGPNRPAIYVSAAARSNARPVFGVNSESASDSSWTSVNRSPIAYLLIEVMRDAGEYHHQRSCGAQRKRRRSSSSLDAVSSFHQCTRAIHDLGPILELLAIERVQERPRRHRQRMSEAVGRSQSSLSVSRASREGACRNVTQKGSART